jgi:hypothetical protein
MQDNTNVTTNNAFQDKIENSTPNEQAFNREEVVLNKRVEPHYYIAGFPQLAIVGYGTIASGGGFTDTNIQHQPYSWSCAKNATPAGSYTVTHNLGHLKYIVVHGEAANAIVWLSNKSLNTFTYNLYNTGGVNTDGDITFVVYAIP